jgi:hypothetical protein
MNHQVSKTQSENLEKKKREKEEDRHLVPD